MTQQEFDVIEADAKASTGDGIDYGDEAQVADLYAARKRCAVEHVPALLAEVKLLRATVNEAHLAMRAWWDAHDRRAEDDLCRRALAVLENATGTTMPQRPESWREVAEVVPTIYAEMAALRTRCEAERAYREAIEVEGAAATDMRWKGGDESAAVWRRAKVTTDRTRAALVAAGGEP